MSSLRTKVGDTKKEINENVDFSIFLIAGVYKAAIGGALLGMAIVDQVTKTIIPAMQKLSLNEALEELKMLPDKQVEQHNDKEEHDQQKQHEDEEKYKQKDDEISELKRKLAELENK